MLALLCYAAALQETSPQTVTLGAYSIGGREVQAIVPADAGPFGSGSKSVSLDGEKYLVDGSGKFVRHFRASGGWSEVREGFAAAKAAITPQTPEWRVKVFLLPRSDILDIAPNGLARIRRSTMEAPEVTHVSESLARFAAMAEASALGKLKLKIDYEVDADTVYQTASANSKIFDEVFLKAYLAPRINGGSYEAEDRVFRGPFDSVFVVHSGFSGIGAMTSAAGSPVSPISFYTEGRPIGAHALSIAIFNAWVRHLAFAAARSGYRFTGNENGASSTTSTEQSQGFGPVVSDSLSNVKGTMWSAIAGNFDPTTETLMRNVGTGTSARAWQEVSDDPFLKLPLLSISEIGTKVGINGLAATAFRFTYSGFSESATGIAADSRFEPGSEAAAVLPYQNGRRQLTFVDSSFAELFGKGLPAASQPRALGWTTTGGRAFFVFDSERVAVGQPEAAMIELPGFRLDSVAAAQINSAPSEDEVAAQLTPDGTTALEVPASGGTIVTDATDSDRGDVLSLRTIGLVRTGSALLLGQRNGRAIFDAATHPYLSFYMKAQNAEPMDLIVVPADDSADKRTRIFGRWPVPSEIGIDDPAMEIVLPATQGWNQVVIDLRKIGVGKASAVYLGANEFVGYWSAKQAAAPTVFLDDIKVTKTAPGNESELRSIVEVTAAADSVIAEGRALFAAKAPSDASEATVTSLIALLKDPDDMVRLNAARAFSRIKSPSAETALGDLVHNLEPRIAEAALDALAFQDTPTGWAMVKRAVEVGPFDFTRVFAVRAYGRKKDPKSLPTLSLALTTSSWHGRMYAAEAIGAMPEQPLPLVLMAFLVETNPAVRLAATKGALVSDDEVCKRLLWSAVNDPSDEIRAWSCWKLIESGNAKYVNEGLKGVRDDSVWMRKRLLQIMRDKPGESIRPALRLAVADASPSVRAEALLTFAKIPGQVTAEEVQNTLSDPDPRVKSALAVLKEAKGF